MRKREREGEGESFIGKQSNSDYNLLFSAIFTLMMIMMESE